jgi:hypothetical protein
MIHFLFFNGESSMGTWTLSLDLFPTDDGYVTSHGE